MNRKKEKFFLIAFFFITNCATSSLESTFNSNSKEKKLRHFLEFFSKNPEQIWSPNISLTVKNALNDYQTHRRVNDQTEYGASVRVFNLKKKSLIDIEQSMQQLNCKKIKDVLKDPGSNRPARDFIGRPVPMYVYLCKDGGVFRVKPQGDPTSQFRPWPHASKSLRYPYNSKFESFEDEIVKVDNSGRAIPKWSKDLNQIYLEPSRQKDFIEGWAEDAHTDLSN